MKELTPAATVSDDAALSELLGAPARRFLVNGRGTIVTDPELLEPSAEACGLRHNRCRWKTRPPVV